MRSGRRVTLWAGAAVAMLLLAGCARVAGGDATPSISSPPPSASTGAEQASAVNTASSRPTGATQAAVPDAPLLGTTWFYTGRINNDVHLDEPADPDAWVRFSANSVTFNGTVQLDAFRDVPCPTWTADAVVTDTTVTLTKDEKDDEEAHVGCGFRFLDAFTGSVDVSRTGRTLSVHIDQGQNQYTFLFSADRPTDPTLTAPDLSFLPAPSEQTVQEQLEGNVLRGRSFHATSATGRTLAGRGIGLDFGLDQAMLSTGCNGGSTGYTIDGNKITFTGGAMTLVGCSDRKVSEQESWVMSFLLGVRSFTLDGSTLTIIRGTEQLVMADAEYVPQASDAPSTEPTSASAEPRIITAIDEIVDSRGHHRLPTLEKGRFWSEPAMTLSATRLSFTVGCGQYVSVLQGSVPKVTMSIGVGEIDSACPATRSKLAATLRYILSGPVTTDRDGAFFTFTGRDGLQVTAHNGYQSG